MTGQQRNPTTHPPALPASGKGAPTTSNKTRENSSHRLLRRFCSDGKTGRTVIGRSRYYHSAEWSARQ